jgi:hypothetical protein
MRASCGLCGAPAFAHTTRITARRRPSPLDQLLESVDPDDKDGLAEDV